MKELILYILLFILGMTVFVFALAIAACASMLVIAADYLIKVKFNDIINGRSSNVRETK